ncbi:hypothetical protein H0H92_000037 [Tricholoma furcatifolium]|nr:hypothetical protein H0H92_000037 [Tricholoma furcatifolium]
MPTNNPLPIALPKVCASCQSSLIDQLSSTDGPLCTSCKERSRLDSRTYCVDPSSPFSLSSSFNVSNIFHDSRQIPKPQFLNEEMIVDAQAPTSRSCHATSCITNSSSYTNPKQLTTLTIPCNTIDSISSTSPVQNRAQPHTSSRQAQAAQYPDPLTDITRLRVRSNGSDCLYPGATFRGVQKSGRNNYDVDVTIVDVNFASSYLCGYLRIRGLTDDHPDLTTYFDAEIIGTRYGFLTRNWGASEQEDFVHWARFPAFHKIKDELKRPHMKLADRDRSIVFMRWKERFLVPNHRVSEINGASFAGFYYICVDFNPPPPRRSESADRHLPLTSADSDVHVTASDLTSKSEVSRHSRRDSMEATVQRAAERVPALASRNPPAAKMTGFYYHRNSEPTPTGQRLNKQTTLTAHLETIIMTSSDRKPRIVIIGAGLAGITTAIQLKKQIAFDNFTVCIECIHKTIRGTEVLICIMTRSTKEHPKLGCGSDVPGHWYSLSTDLNPNWSSHFIGQPEIRAYWEELYFKYDLSSHTVLGHAVVLSEWDSDAQLYHITVKEEATGKTSIIDAEILVSAIGGFMSPLIPKDLSGVEQFRGVAWHSARWRHDVDLKGKRVAVIGNGCSA